MWLQVRIPFIPLFIWAWPAARAVAYRASGTRPVFAAIANAKGKITITWTRYLQNNFTMKNRKTNSNHSFINAVKKKYSTISVDIDMIRGFSMKKQDLEFIHIVQCAYVKTYDFLMYSSHNRDAESA